MILGSMYVLPILLEFFEGELAYLLTALLRTHICVCVINTAIASVALKMQTLDRTHALQQLKPVPTMLDFSNYVHVTQWSATTDHL